MTRIPRRQGTDDYTREAADERRAFATERTGASLEHVGAYSVDPAELPGNVEHFMGVAQVPVGLAGPLLVDGEHAQGEFYVPMATTEGTLVASYNRGMKLMREAGGVRTTVIDDAMQRAPCFVLPDAREARRFGEWLAEHVEDLRREAEATTRSGRLRDVQQFGVGRMRYLRFNYTTGDAAGQNMTGKATFMACKWIVEHFEGTIDRWYLEANLATDKKHSQMNLMHTRGKRVVAEVTLPDALVREHMRTTAEQLFLQRLTSQTGSLISRSSNNGAHAANGITAIFIACGQDVANVAESHAAIAHAELTPEGDYRYSITLPALIVATHGGGTGLPTQRECLELMGCFGRDRVLKFAEIVAATVAAGELSLGAAIVAEEWVSSHDQYGRNRGAVAGGG